MISLIPPLRRQKGYFLVIAIVLILVIGMMGALITYLFANRAQISAAALDGLRSFYLAESGVEIGTHYLSRPSLSTPPARIRCSDMTGHTQLTNAVLGSGTFTISTINSSPIYAINTLSTAITASAVTLNANSTASFAPSGRITIDGENIDYAAISGNAFVGLTRGADGTLPSPHAAGAGIGQYQCDLSVKAGIPTVTSANFKREIQANVTLQEAWAVGNTTGNHFIFSRWNHPAEMNWSLQSISGGSNAAHINGISMLSQADGWAVGNEVQNNLIFLHWIGSTWQLITVAGCNGQDLASVSMVSSREGYAVGARYKPNCGGGNNRFTLIKWNGSTWSALVPPAIPTDNNSNQNLNAVHVIDSTGVGTGTVGFAVGDNGQILYYNGSTWVQVASPVTQNLLGVYTVSAQEAWAVGTSGRILRWNGSTWSAVSSPVTSQLNDIAMFDTNGDGVAEMGWIAGNSGIILTYNGSGWSSTDVGSANLLGVGVFNEEDVWIVGANGLAYHWDGSAWTSFSTGTSVQLNHMSVISTRQPLSNWQQVFA